MPELVTDKSNPTPSSENVPSEPCVPHKEHFAHASPRSPLSTQGPESDSIDLGDDSPKAARNSIDQLYHNVCEMQSSDRSPSRFSYLSYGQESRIDSELRYLAGGNFAKADSIEKESIVTADEKEATESDVTAPKNKKMNQPLSTKTLSSAKIPKPGPKSKSLHDEPPNGKKSGLKSTPKKNEKNSPTRLQNGNEDPRYLRPYLLKQTRELLSSGDNPNKALELAVRAMKSFESCQSEKPDLEFIMCLHIVAALYCLF